MEEETAYSRCLADVEKDYILNVLRLSRGNLTRSAKTLKISKRTLCRKLDSWGVPRGTKCAVVKTLPLR